MRLAQPASPAAAPKTVGQTYDRRDQTMLFNLQNSVATGVHKTDREFWDALPYLRAPYQ